MNLQDYIQRIKLWIDKQYFIIRHYKIIISVFLVIIVGILIVGVLYPHEEEPDNTCFKEPRSRNIICRQRET